jgi:hypothetical protein
MDSDTGLSKFKTYCIMYCIGLMGRERMLFANSVILALPPLAVSIVVDL